MIYGDQKFVLDPITKKQKLVSKYLNKVREFNMLKKFVCNCADSKGMLNTELFKSFLDQVDLRSQML